MPMFKQIAKYVAIGLVALFVVTYAVDFVVFELRSRSGSAFETRKITPTYAVPEKNGRDEFMFGDPTTVTCVHSLFPHNGDQPCWYLDRNSAKPIAM
jgi:hypothetical protein